MDREANVPTGPTSIKYNFLRPINPDSNLSRSFTSTSSSSSSSFSSSSPPGLLRDVQAAFKRHRSFISMQSNSIRPRRVLVSALNVGSIEGMEKTQDEIPQSHRVRDSVTETKNMASVVAETRADVSITPPSVLGATSVAEESFKPFVAQRDQPRPIAGCPKNDIVSSVVLESQRLPLPDGQRKVQFSLENNARSQGADDQMVTGTDNLLSHMGSLALTEMDWDTSTQVEASTAISRDSKQQNFQSTAADISLKSDEGISSSLAKRTTRIQDQLHQFRNFLQSDLSHPMTQSSIVGSSCATTTIMNSDSAPMLNATTYCPQPHQSSGSTKVKTMSENLVSEHLSKSNQSEVKECDISKDLQNNVRNEREIPKDPPFRSDKSMEGKELAGNVTDIQSQAPSSRNQLTDVKLEPSKLEKQEKVPSGKTAAAPRKKSYDADLFFKVNGKLYQRLGKIGSGGSSEVHKVISSDCKIYALKKIKLKGRDNATAYGFCQEIDYLNKLKGKTNIIQLIDYEVTDKTLLREVLNGTMSNKDGRVKEDGYIYMVLEYGEIDLAHMLSQKWKENDGSNATIDENWLRFYWQQILQAVNTIHEERIVHSDLKPANFLLVKGSLKLIDFGIAKAIMSDTTNIQRDSQVGTLSYMSPEAFMCNETDANGNTIKCGRPSDIWSLGCILYQMVYGRTPFSEYKTFWAKFKVITDPNHEITYESVPNPWLLDLMKKCLAWDRNERWRIPQLLQHPFIVPPIPPKISSPSHDKSCRLAQLVSESCTDDPKALMLCCQLQQRITDPRPATSSEGSVSRDQWCKLLCEKCQNSALNSRKI